MVEQVQVPHSVVAGKEPLPEELIVGGLAVNLKDFALYSKGYDGVIIRLTGTVAITDDNDTEAEVFLPWVKTAGAGTRQYTSSAKLSFIPATGVLHATAFAGNGSRLTGLTSGQIEEALDFSPARRSSAALAAEATNLETVIALANSLRSALINSGIGS